MLTRCTCPSWDDGDDFDGRNDYEDACRDCPEHGLAGNPWKIEEN